MLKHLCFYAYMKQVSLATTHVYHEENIVIFSGALHENGLYSNRPYALALSTLSINIVFFPFI